MLTFIGVGREAWLPLRQRPLFRRGSQQELNICASKWLDIAPLDGKAPVETCHGRSSQFVPLDFRFNIPIKTPFKTPFKPGCCAGCSVGRCITRSRCRTAMPRHKRSRWGSTRCWRTPRPKDPGSSSCSPRCRSIPNTWWSLHPKGPWSPSAC